MVLTKKKTTSIDFVQTVVHGMQELKANDIISLDLTKLKSAVADYFVIAHAESGTQVRAIADSVEEEMYKAYGENPWRREGKENGEWIILDYIDIVVHVFQTQKRHFYGIEDFWGDATIQRY